MDLYWRVRKMMWRFLRGWKLMNSLNMGKESSHFREVVTNAPQREALFYEGWFNFLCPIGGIQFVNNSGVAQKPQGGRGRMVLSRSWRAEEFTIEIGSKCLGKFDHDLNQRPLRTIQVSELSFITIYPENVHDWMDIIVIPHRFWDLPDWVTEPFTVIFV